MKGTVIKSTGSWYIVRTESGEILQTRITGKFRLNGKKLTNPVAVGDYVIVEGKDEEWVISEILDRKNYVIRQSPRKKHYLHILASNIDQALLVITIRDPKLKQGFIDRFLLMTEPYDIPVYIVFNKIDIYTAEDFEMYEYMKVIYENIGYHVLNCSAETRQGIEEINAVLKDKITLISGQSGVGKSSLINEIEPKLEIKTTDLSNYTGKGQHTTTFAEMFELSFGGQIIDSPGIKMLSYNHMEIMDVAHNFREFFILSKECKFGDCTHRNEPKCAVKHAIEVGAISELRYNNYLQILDEIEAQNYWEINDDY